MAVVGVGWGAGEEIASRDAVRRVLGGEDNREGRLWWGAW